MSAIPTIWCRATMIMSSPIYLTGWVMSNWLPNSMLVVSPNMECKSLLLNGVAGCSFELKLCCVRVQASIYKTVFLGLQECSTSTAVQ